MNTQDNSLPKMKVVYGISRWTNASRAAARHIDDGNGKPLCPGRGRKVFSWERDEDVPTCGQCIRLFWANESRKQTASYWDCECDDSYIHPKNEESCSRCGCDKDDQPDSIVFEVLLASMPLIRCDSQMGCNNEWFSPEEGLNDAIKYTACEHCRKVYDAIDYFNEITTRNGY